MQGVGLGLGGAAAQRRAVLQKALLGQLDEAPVLGRQALAHRRGGQAQAAQGVAHAGRVFGVGQVVDQQALELGTVFQRRRRLFGHQGGRFGQLAEPHQLGDGGLFLAVQSPQRDARQAGAVLGALGVAAEPEQVLGRTAGHQPLALHQRGVGGGDGDQRAVLEIRCFLRRFLAQHPGVGAAAAQRHGGQAGAFAHQARHAAGQHAPGAGAVGQREHAQDGRARHDAGVRAALPGRHLRRWQVGLHGVLFGHAADAVGPRGQHLVAHQRAHAGLEGATAGGPRVGGLDDALAQLRQHVAQGGRLAAPPGVQGGQQQFFAQQFAPQGGQKTQQRAGFEKARARRVGHHHVAGAHRLQQAGHAQARFGAHFQRVEEGIVHPLDDAVHRLQAVQRLQVQALVAHRQIAPFDQRDAQVACQVGVLEIGFVVRPRRQQHDVRIGAGCHGLQALDEAAVGVGQAAHVHGLERVGELGGHGRAVFQQVAQARRRLRALRHHPPEALRPARQIERHHVQVLAAHRRHAVHGAQVVGVALHQRGGQQAVLQQPAQAVDVGHHGFEHAHALQHAGFDVRPVVGRDQQREQIQRPGSLQVGLVGVDVVGDAVVAQLARQARGAAVQLLRVAEVEMAEELLPGRRQRQRAGRRHRGTRVGGQRRPGVQLVEVGGVGQRKQGAGRRQGRRGGQIRCVHPRWRQSTSCHCRIRTAVVRRRSSVHGNSRLPGRASAAGGAAARPAVCPMGAKRARRRLSAS